MLQLNLDKVNCFVNENIVIFHNNKINIVKKLKLKDVLKKKNPYLFKAKNIHIASELIENILDAYLSSSEEKIFGDFLENLAIYISLNTCGGVKPGTTGIDLDFSNDGVRYLISIKSGTNWGNSSQHKKQEDDFNTAVRVIKQGQHTANIQPVLGICYGKTKTTHTKGYMKVVGQNFWYLISGNENLYTDIIEPIGYMATEHNEEFNKQKSSVINVFTEQFLNEFCDDGIINWKKLVEFNSGNL